MTKEPKCRDKASELLPWYVNGTLDEAERRDVHLHLESCSECRDDYELLCDVNSAVNQRMPVPIVPPPNTEKLFARVDAPHTQSHSGKRSRRSLIAAALAASLLIAVVFGRGMFAIDTPTRFETATSNSGSASIDYVLRIHFQPATDAAARQEVFDLLSAREVSRDTTENIYRLLVSVPGTSLEEVEAYTEPAESRADVSSIEIIAVQLPMRKEP